MQWYKLILNAYIKSLENFPSFYVELYPWCKLKTIIQKIHQWPCPKKFDSKWIDLHDWFQYRFWHKESWNQFPTFGWRNLAKSKYLDSKSIFQFHSIFLFTSVKHKFSIMDSGYLEHFLHIKCIKQSLNVFKALIIWNAWEYA